MPLPGTYPANYGQTETIDVIDENGGRFTATLPRGSYSVTVYSDGMLGVVFPEYLRARIYDETGIDSICLRVHPEDFVSYR